MKMRCPHCGVSGSVDDSYLGRTLSCPKCRAKFEAAPEMVLDQPLQPVEEPAAVVQQVELQEDVSGNTVTDEPGKEPFQSAEPPAESSAPPADPDQLELVPSEVAQEVEPPDIEAPGQESNKCREEQRSEWEQQAEEKQLAPDNYPEVPGGEWENTGFSITGSLKEAWQQTKGVKGQIWLAIFVNVLILGAIDGMISGLAWLLPEGSLDAAVTIIGQIGSGIVSTILTAGLIYMGVKRLKGEDIHWRDLFSGFAVAGKLTITWLLSLILMFIGYLLLVLPGIYLTVGYGLALPLVVDKKMSPWQALETSRKAIHKVWWRFFALMLLLTLITVIAAIPLGIGLIWVVPMGVVLIGVVYKTILPREILAD